MIKTLLTAFFIFSIGGCIVYAVVVNEERKDLIKDYNSQIYPDTPNYYKQYIKTSIIHGNKNLH